MFPKIVKNTIDFSLSYFFLEFKSRQFSLFTKVYGQPSHVFLDSFHNVFYKILNLDYSTPLNSGRHNVNGPLLKSINLFSIIN